MKRILDKDYIWNNFVQILPVVAALASILFDGLSFFLALQRNFLLAMFMTFASALVISLVLFWWVQWRGISSQDERFRILEIFECYEFISPTQDNLPNQKQIVIHTTKRKIIAKRRILSIPIPLYQGQGQEIDFEAWEDGSGRRIQLNKQLFSGQPVVIYSPLMPIKPSEEHVFVVRSKLVNGFPGCNGDGFRISLPGGLKSYVVDLQMPKRYFTEKAMLTWYKLHSFHSFEVLDQGRVEGLADKDIIRFHIDLSNKLNQNWYTTFVFHWEWHIPDEECIDHVS